MDTARERAEGARAVAHITIEHSANLADHHDVQALVGAVHTAAAAHGLTPLDGLRTRAVTRNHYRIAAGDPDYAFVAITVRVGPGRDAAARRTYLETILDAAEAHIGATPSPLAVAWSAEVTEIDAAFRINRNEVRARIAEQRQQRPESLR
ncbi:MAG: hypothetical protein OXP08_07100 [bacterium]|nr:hypothetical protein [bacterium]